MTLQLKEYVAIQQYKIATCLMENLNKYTTGAKSGQIVFLVKSSDHEKSPLRAGLVKDENFRIRNLDGWINVFKRLERLKSLHQSLQHLNLRSPEGTENLKDELFSLGIKDADIKEFLEDITEKKLPNVLFDITFKEMNEVQSFIPNVSNVGYQSSNIHIVWVLNNHKIAITGKGDGTITAQDLMIYSHSGSDAKSLYKLVKDHLPEGMDGNFDVILNHSNHMIPFVDKAGKHIQGKKQIIIKSDILRLMFKERGKPVGAEIDIMDQLHDNLQKHGIKGVHKFADRKDPKVQLGRMGGIKTDQEKEQKKKSLPIPMNRPKSDQESSIKSDAEKMGLQYLGFGRWGKGGKETHFVKAGRLVPFKSKDELGG